MEDDTCEVCTDTLDATDSSISFCDCNYAVCLWCARPAACMPAPPSTKPRIGGALSLFRVHGEAQQDLLSQAAVSK